MIAAIVVVSLVLVIVFVLAAVAGNRAQTRMLEMERARRDARDQRGEES